MSNQENKQEQIQFSAQQELKHLRTRCGKVYALGNNRFRAVVQTTPVHEYDAATHQWVELSAEKRQQMAAQAHSPIAMLADNSADSAVGILDTYVKEGSTQNFSHDERLWISNTNYYGNRLTYLKVVDLPRLGANHFITSAKLCVRNVYAPTADTAIMCTEVLEDWNPETITYDHQPDVSGVYQDYCRVLKNQYSWKEFDVTSLARKWYLGENHGVQLRAPESESSFSQLHSSETANQPYFVLEYASLAGLESYLTYDHQSAGLAGTGNVSLVNGNLIFSHADTAMNGNRLPVSVTHYYNSCDSDKDEFGMGYGWRTSLHQTLHKVLYNGEEEFVYTDGDGTEHFFKKNKDDQKKYSDQSGLSLTLEVGDENVTITDKGDNGMTFPLVSDTPTEDAPETAKVLIQKIQDAVGNEVTVTALADSPLKIASVTDGANRVTTLHYTDGRCDRIQTPWQDAKNCVRFKYENGALVKILHEDNRASEYVYNEEIGYHLLKKAYGADGAFVEYAYTNTGKNRVDGLPHCITHATVTGTKNGTTLTAANISYTYGNHMALVKDEISGKTLRYHFNDDGNQTSVDDELGYAMYTRYDRTDDNANAPINHATERSRMQRVVRNLLLDPMCEENSSVWEKSSDALGYVAGAHFLEELGTAVDGFDAAVRIESSFKTAGSFGTQAEHTARMTDVGAFEGSTFEDDRRRLVRDFRIHAAHDAGDAAGFFFIGDDQHVVGQFTVYIIQSLQGFIGFGPAGDEVMAGDFIVVIGMEWDAQFDHGVVGSVDDVVDGTDAGLAQALLHPHRRLADLDVQEQAGGIAAAQFFVVNGYFDLAVDGRVTFFDGNIRVTGFFAAEDGEFTGQADHGEAVGAVGRQFIFIDDVADLEIVGRIDAEGRIGRQDPNAFPFFRQEQAVVEAEFVGRAEHAVGQDAAQLRALDLSAARQMSAVDGDGDDLADADVGRSRDDLELFIPHVYLADDEFIRIGVLVDLKDLPGLYFLDFCPPVFHLFDRDTGNGQFIGKCLHVLVHVDVDIILHPFIKRSKLGIHVHGGRSRSSRIYRMGVTHTGIAFTRNREE